jgi:DNA-binding SARP family transcriptional activator/tetratricopeptide (TPR) repeat protein
MLRVRLFGGVEADLDGEPVEAPARRRAWFLFAWLALHPGLHPRGELAARFWPDVLDQSARASLRSALWALRRALGPPGAACLVAAGDRVGIEPGADVWVDALAFDALVAEGRLEDAVALCQGALLAGVDEDWALRASEEHRSRLVELLERLAAAAAEGGRLQDAVRLTRRQTGLDPFSEETHRRLMRRLALAGDRPAALMVHARLVDRLRRELRLAPSALTRQLAAELRQGGRVEVTEPARPAAAPGPAPSGRARRRPLIGRERDLARLTDAWRAALAGAGSAVAIGGEGGIGKSRLAAELLELARRDGARTAACGSLDLGGVAPFGLWAELLRDVARDLEPPAGAAWPAEAARLAPELEGRAGWTAPSHPPVAPELERARLFEAVVALAEWAARERPLVLLLEDVHLADAASLELAAYLARRISAHPLLMVLTRRDLPARAEVDALLHALRAHGVLADELALRPLTRDAIGRVVRGIANLDADDVRRIIDASEGNPLLAVESARALAAGERSLPAGVRGAARAAALALDEQARAVAELVAVAGRGLDQREIAALPLDDPVEAATAAVESGLLVADQGRVAFRHALLREAVYADMPAPRRTRLHATFAQVLADRTGAGSVGRAAEIARHLRLAGRDDLAVEHLARAAADAQSVGALAGAVDFLEEALRLEPDDPRLLLALAEAQAWRGRRADAAAALAAALTRIGPRASPALLDAHLRAGRWFRGALCDPRASLRAYREALALLDDGLSASRERRADAVVGAAWCEAVAGDLDAADALLAQFEALLRDGGVDPILAHDAGAARGHALLRRGRFVDACEPLLAAGEAALRGGRPDLTGDCWSNAAAAMASAGRFDTALEITDRALAYMRESGLVGLELVLLAGRAHILARMGRLPEAAEDARAEREIAARLDDPALGALADHDAGLIALAAGDHGAAEALLASALGGGAPVSRPLARLARAEALLRLGRCEEAEGELNATALEPVRPSDFPDTLVARLTRIEGLLAAARGNRCLAARRLEQAAAMWRRRGADADAGEQWMTNIVDLGRAPVVGLIEPARELRRVMDDIEALHAATA